MIIKMMHGCGAAKDPAAKGDKVADHDQKLETNKRDISDRVGRRQVSCSGEGFAVRVNLVRPKLRRSAENFVSLPSLGVLGAATASL
jgi:hypothetical protein